MLLLLGLTALFLFVFHQCYWRRRHLPPGPFPLPFVGNALTFNKYERWEEMFLKWREEFGPVYTYWLGLLPIVSVNSFELLEETFVKNGEHFADRNSFVAFNKVTRQGSYGIIDTSGDLWREQRRFALKTLRDFGFARNRQEQQILDEVETIFAHLNRNIEAGIDEHDVDRYTSIATGSLINNLICGYRYTENGKEEEFYKMKNTTENILKAFADPFVSLSVVSEFVAKLPVFRDHLQGMADLFNKVFDHLDSIICDHERRFQEAIANEENFEPADFIDSFLLEKKRLEDANDANAHRIQLKNVCFDLWFGGQETTSANFTWAIAFLIRNPDVQRRAHEELDRKIGGDRWITINDRAELPFLQAVIAETLRCANGTGMNIPRKTTREVEVGGFRLLAGTVVVPQISAIHGDPNLFPNPKVFDPSRFIDESGKLKSLQHIVAFSVGKRQCPGEGMARMSLFLILANLLNHYKFSAGKEPPSLRKLAGGSSVQTKPFTCRLERRFAS
ncbi:(pine wood nematode) hypothetical protein [Aphelenchoides fujianensis]|nr:(pine wood nematode) hypothetical protein [Aphelenchoides fujianensis]